MTPETLMEWLKERMDRIEDKVDAVQAHCHNIDKTLAKNTEDIARHIRRTDTLQEMVEAFKRHLARVNGIVWFVGFLATVAAVLKGFSII